MVKRQTALKIRKMHRYLGVFLGIQFLIWTISGMYFSWTDIDEIHGDQFKNPVAKLSLFDNLISPTIFKHNTKITSLELRDIAGKPYYWINKENLVNAKTGEIKKEVSAKEALAVAGQNMLPELKVKGIEKIAEVGNHHEYRGRPLPVYVISYDSQIDIKSYVSIADGSFQTLRHRNWRWFDFLWMTHTMDYQGRDNFNTIVLRVFSLLGLITVLSGFMLWYISSPTIRKINKKN
ncbi:PepSY domain-containing protein [Maribacter polysaccharolyticus]|uniref:PepSY domain-containing protein n=1 Tax=Maribacter polysaccharolyticus TaxID=3020831 RepID=UPI00237F4C3D|nr:PepSY domain-containing protein [Maribacter polysaccharolyticus]MDE3741063.1 PepSY domain-containing protein [Maribacter polysaccharolyticus]